MLRVKIEFAVFQRGFCTSKDPTGRRLKNSSRRVFFRLGAHAAAATLKSGIFSKMSLIIGSVSEIISET
jgi:hypothetical protein